MKHFPAAFACETYGNRTVDQDGNPTTAYDWQKPLAAPSNTSGWFLPSLRQLLDLFECSFLTESMSAVKNSLPDDCDYKNYIGWLEAKDYWTSWSSSEGGEESAAPERAKRADYRYSTGMAFNGTALKKQKNNARAILAF